MANSALADKPKMAAILVVVFGVCFALFGGTLLNRPFWMDEIHSWLLITDPDAFHALKALGEGADYNPPVYYALARVFSAVAGLSETTLRIFSLLLSWGTAVVLAIVFRRQMTWWSAVGASLFVCSQSLFILQTTEVRFYALWLFLLSAFCCLLTAAPSQKAGIRHLGLCVLASLIAGTHYFGIISIGIVCTAHAVNNRLRRANLIPAGLPVIAAVVTVACCLPLLAGQKEALTAATWVKPPTLDSATKFLRQFFPGIILLTAGAVWLSGKVFKPSSAQHPQSPSSHSDTGSQNQLSSKSGPWLRQEDAVFGSLLFMPVALIIFSYAVQPALVNRYASVGTLWLVPVLSRLLPALDIRKSLLVFAAGSLLFAFAVRHGSATWDYNLKPQQQLADSVNSIPKGTPVLFEDRVDYWMLQKQQTSEDWNLLDFDTPPTDDLAVLRIVQRDVGRAVQRHYPNRYRMKSVRDVSQPVFYVVPYRGKAPRREWLPQQSTLTNVNKHVFKVQRKTAR